MRRHRRPPISPHHPCLHRPGGPTAPQPEPVPPRTLHLIDVDNLLGDPTTSDPARIDLLFRTYRRTARFSHGDHAVVAAGCNAEHVFAVEVAWPEAQHRRARGPDGADLALLDAADWAATSGRFERVVLGSGDHIFLVALDRLRAANIHVEVVARARSLATALAVRARGAIRYLPELTASVAA